MNPLLPDSARRLGAILLATALPAVAAPLEAANLTGLWLFDNAGNVGEAAVGSDLGVSGTAPTWNGTLADDGANSLTGVITTAGGVGNHLVATHNIAPNGGGAFVNEYSLLVDLFSPAASRGAWRSIYQTNISNSNDGDYFIRNSDDALGVAALTYTPSPINESAWTRLVVTFDLGSEVRTYLDGSLVHVHNGDSVDGRFALDPTVLLFADEDGENTPLNVGTVAMWDGVLSGPEVAALGRAGDPVPEPTVPLLAGMALASLALARRRPAS